MLIVGRIQRTKGLISPRNGRGVAGRCQGQADGMDHGNDDKAGATNVCLIKEMVIEFETKK